MAIFTGTALAQLVPLLVSPILTRLYSPELFGIFASFVAISTIIGSIASLRYEVSIPLPKRIKHAYAISHIAITFIVATTVLSFLGLWFYYDDLVNILKDDAFIWLFFIPLTVFFIGTNQVVSYLSNREKLFYALAKNRVVQSLTTSASQLGLFFIQPYYGLALGFITGIIISTYNLTRITLWHKRSLYKRTNHRVYRTLAHKYKNFALYDTPTVLLNIAVNQLPTILFTTIFSPAVAGFYYLTQRVLQAPISLISGSVLEVFKEKAASDYRSLGNAASIYKKTFILLILISLPPSILLYFYVTDIFIFFFGQQWATAGSYAEIMLPALFLRFIANPLSFMLYIGQKQKINLIIMMALFMTTIASFYLLDDPYKIIKVQSISLSIMYIVHLIISAKIAGIFNIKN